MSRNMRSKRTATDHTYVHSYGRFLSFDVSQHPAHLKSEQNVEMKRLGVVRQKENVVWTWVML